MGSLSCDRVRPITTLEPLIQQETELLTFSPIIGQPQRSPLIKKNARKYNKKHSQLQRRSVTFLTLKYGFVIFVVASSVATLCDIDKLKVDLLLFSDSQLSNQTLESTNLTFTFNGTINQPLITQSSINSINNSNQFMVPSSIDPTLSTIILLPGSNISVSTVYLNWVYHKMKIPLYVYMAVALSVLFMAIFGRTVENFFIPFSFGMFMLLEIGTMFGLCLKEIQFDLGYSSQLWTIYILHLIFSFSYSLIILFMHQHV